MSNQSRERERAVASWVNPVAVPGQLLVEREELFVFCGGNTLLEILEVQLEGRRRMTAAEFIRGSRPQTNERLEWELPL